MSFSARARQSSLCMRITKRLPETWPAKSTPGSQCASRSRAVSWMRPSPTVKPRLSFNPRIWSTSTNHAENGTRPPSSRSRCSLIGTCPGSIVRGLV